MVLPRGTRPIPQWRPITLKFRGGFPRGFTTTSRILTKDLGAWDLEFSNYWRILAVTYDRSEGLQGGLLKRRNSGSCETTGKWRALLVTFKSQAPVSSQRAPKVCQIRLLCQRETLMGTSTSIVRRKNDEKKRRKRIPKIPGNIRTNNMRAKHVFVLVYHTRKCTNHTQTRERAHSQY